MDVNEIIPTITVIRDGVECVINESDFDPATDKKGAAVPADKPKRGRQPASAPEVAPPAPLQLGVTNIDGRFFVVDLVTGEKVTVDGIDENGYDDDTAAIAAAREAMQ